MRPLTRRSLTAVTWSVLASTFTCSFGDDEEEDDKKPDDKPAERRTRVRRDGSPLAAAPTRPRTAEG